MIGYLRPHLPSPAAREVYRSTMCSLCHEIGREYGFRYRALAGPDMVLYNVFLDAVTGTDAAVARRSCVLAPGVTRLPVRTVTDNTRLAAAVGVWMAAAKLRDDLADEGGLHRWLAVRALAPGARRAAQILADASFPLGEVERWMAAQAEIERREATDLDTASLPTRAIAALVYGARGGPLARQLGEHLGSWLFWVDNLLDRGRDRARGEYNALCRATDPVDEQQVVARARRDVDRLGELLDGLSVAGPRGALLRSALVTGLGDKLTRLSELSGEELQAASLKSILPPAAPLPARMHLAWSSAVFRMPLKFRVTWAMLVAWILPRAAWAERWWPEGVQSLGLEQHPALNGQAGALQPAAHLATANDDFVCDALMANCGWCDLEGCADACNCDGACDDACSSAADTAT